MLATRKQIGTFGLNNFGMPERIQELDKGSKSHLRRLGVDPRFVSSALYGQQKAVPHIRAPGSREFKAFGEQIHVQ